MKTKWIALFFLCIAASTAAVAADADTRCFEMRTYYVAPGKLDAELARMKDHALSLFEKHGFTSIGYWVPLDNPDNKLIYIIASPSREAHDKAWKEFIADPEWQKAREASEVNGKLVNKVESIYLKATDFSPVPAASGGATARCFELRTYTPAPGKLDALQARFRDHTTALFTRHGMTQIGYWTGGAEQQKEQLTYVLAHKDKAAAGASFKAFREDPEWIEAKRASEVDGPLTEKVESVFMTPTDFSPIR
jgi:hypothetical protein